MMIQFFALLYKEVILRRRHYIITLCELILPILFACAPLLLLFIYNDKPEFLIINKTFDEYYNSRNDSSWPHLNVMKYNLENPFEVPKALREKNVTLYLFYAPVNLITNNLMENAVKLFQIKNQYGNLSVKGFSTETELNNMSLIFDTYPAKVISTIFDDNISDKLPESLNYTIRSNAAKHVSPFKNDDRLYYKSIGENTYKEAFFLAWQTAIEQTFIHLRVGTDKNHNFEEFPVKGERYKSSIMYLLDIWPSLFSFGFFIFGLIVTYRITLEKDIGMQSLMGSMGVTQFSYWMSYFTSNFLSAVLISFIITMIYQNPPSEEMLVFKKTNFYILWIFILIFIINLVLFCFIITIFFCKPRPAMLFILLSYVVTFSLLFFPYYYGEHYTYFMNLSYGLKLFICIVPMSSVFYTFELLFVLETGGSGVDWFFIMNPEQEHYFDLSVIINGNLISFFMLIILLWYLDAVWPSSGRISQPIYFPFTINYWCSSFFHLKRIENENLDLDQEFFEPNFGSSYPSVVIQNITKWFDQIWSSNTVIDNLSFNIYSKQITLLLGQEESGKTTLFNILSGMSKPSCGKILINGLDLYSSLPKVKKYFGICPENSVFYETLTVHEHLTLFAGIKGVKLPEITEQVIALEEILQLNAYKNNLAKELSDECKRKLNLGLAVIGKSEILFLDEPTRYMSSDSRYHFWSVLQRLKRDHTIFLTSSSVNDVYNFADKIALFSYGRLLFCGSLNFLNERLDVGFKVRITKDFPFHLHEILKIIHKYYRDAILEKETESFVIINFKSVINMRLGSLFEELENFGKKLGIKSCGITMEPLESILMSESYITVLKNKDSVLVDSEDSSNKDLRIFQRHFNKSWSLYSSQLAALFYKRALYMLRLWGLFVPHILIPFILMSVGFLLLQHYHKSNYSPLYLSMNNIYGRNTFGFVETYPYDNSTSTSIIQQQLLSVMEENQVSVYTHNNVTELINLYSYVFYPHYFTGFLIGGNVLQNGSEHRFVAWYNSRHYHTSPIALNLMHTAILRHFSGNGSIYLKNHPLPCNYISCKHEYHSHKIIILTVTPLVTAFIGASVTIIPIYERVSKAKLFQLMSGLSVNLYWLSMFLWDILMHTGVCFVLILAAFVFYPYYIKDSGSFGAIYLIFFVFGWCTIPISYLMSLVFDRPINTSVYVFLFYSISGLISILVHDQHIYLPDGFAWTFCILPSFTVTEGLYKIFFIPLHTSFCYGINNEILAKVCYKKDNFTMKSPFFKCCHKLCENECEDYLNFTSFDLHIGILREVIILFIIGSLLLLLLKLLEAAIYQSYKGCIFVKPFDEELYRKSNDILSCGVHSEKERIEDALASGKHDEALMVLDLTKYYGSLCAVNDLTFGVNVGESFGIVGGDGAGKSSLFKMISGEIIPTAGNAFIKEYNLVNDLKQFQSYVGYCPQYDALLNHLTGKEMLRFISKLRGVVGEDFLPILIKMIEIEDIADKLIKHYSFANKRKLAVAAATIGSPLILIMDEPTTGIDFKSKKIIWNLLNKIKSCNLSAIIFSCPSILECQKLHHIGFCTKLAVIDHGTFQCIGSLEKLEEIYSTGKIVKIIIKQESLDLTCIFKAKGFFESTVPKATLLAYHQTYIPENESGQKQSEEEGNFLETKTKILKQIAEGEGTTALGKFYIPRW